MATVRIKFRASSIEKREGTLYYQIIHNRLARQINTGYKLHSCEWDAAKTKAKVNEAKDEQRRQYLAALNTEVELGLSTLQKVISALELKGEAFTAESIVAKYEEARQQGGFMSFVCKQIAHFQRANRVSAATKLGYALNSFRKFVGKDDLPFDNVTSDLMEEYEGWLRKRGNCSNTVSFYMRQLRPVYNLAVERGLADNKQPFKHVYTGIDQTVKRAIPLTVIRKIQGLDLTGKPHLDRARDLFLFSLYTRGMSFVDMCNLKKTDLKDGILTYRRQKTKRLMMVKWEKPMQQILDKLGKTDGTALLPIIDDRQNSETNHRTNALHKLNRNLSQIGRMVGLDILLTSYVARHTWASLAQSSNVSIGTISRGLGHDNESTTRIYLAAIDTSAVDKANSKILNILKTV